MSLDPAVEAPAIPFGFAQGRLRAPLDSGHKAARLRNACGFWTGGAQAL